ncbi:hypothetical protein CTI12_AA486350 [Artemisia annua]|uniref:Uncharacterized protein n=1 Tax=Artemisia annua TaxID=35608 RepID=A0A2U1LHP5_ARTAN|nr:hypothetical protein CTI12_AA486350 [Artemisia annua]
MKNLKLVIEKHFWIKKRSVQKLDEQMILNHRKVQALLKENSDLKSENSRLQKTTSNFNSVNTKLENENQEFLKRTNDHENKLRKLGQTSQTLNMLPTRGENINTQTSGIGFENIDHVENAKPGFLNKVQKLTPIIYNANDMGKELSTDLLFESEDILKSEDEKRLKVKQRKTPFSYHGFVYGCTQLTDIPKEPFKRKDTNVKRFFKEAQLATYDAKLWQYKARKQFCNLKHHIEQTLKVIWFKQENISTDVWSNPLSSDVRLKIQVQKILKDEIEPRVKDINLSFEYFEKYLVTEMREDLKYVHSLEDEFDEKCLILDIQKEFFTNQIESFKSASVSHENENVNFEQTSSLKNENLCLNKKITELSKEATDVKEELSKRTAQFEKDLAKLKAQSISFQLKLQEKNEKSVSENSLTSVLKGKEKIFEENCDDTKVKFDFDELDTKNIELEHAVASLQKENEHLKQIYKNLFDSIKRSRVPEQKSNITHKETENLKSQLSEFADNKFENVLQKIESMQKKRLEKENIQFERKLARKTDDSKAEKDQFLKQIASLESKLASQDHLSLQKEYNDLRTSYNALKAKFDALNRTKGKSHVSNESKPQVNVSEKVYTGESSKSFSKRVSQFTTYSLQKGRKFSKRPNFSETFTPQKPIASIESHAAGSEKGRKGNVNQDNTMDSVVCSGQSSLSKRSRTSSTVKEPILQYMKRQKSQ